MKKRNWIITIMAVLIVTLCAGCNGAGTPVADTTEETPVASESPVPSENPEQISEESTTEGTENAANEKTPATDASKPQNNETPKPVATPSQSNDAPTAQPQSTPAPVQTPAPKPSISASVLISKIVGSMGANNLSEMPSELYEGVYGIDPANYESVSIYGSMVNVKANEVIVIQAKSEDDVSSAKAALSARKANLEEQWKRYLPDQYELVQNGKIVTKGQYAALIIGDGVSGGVSAFNNAI